MNTLFSPRIRVALAGAAVLAAVCSLGQAYAQSYPSQPIKLVLGFPPGGASDLLARRLAEQMGRQMGQPFVVDNRPGASGNIAAAYAAKSAPDGYTVFYGTNTTHAMNISLYPKLEFDPVKDFEAVGMQGKVWNVLSVHPSFDATTLPAFLAKAKASPGTINVASPGNATSPHLALELLKGMAGVDVTHIPYKGSAAALNDVVGGQVPVMFDNIPASLPFIKAGKLKPIAVSSPKRLGILPDVPTFDEMGLKGYEVSGWGALWVPARTPRAIIERLNRELNLALKDPKVLEAMATVSLEPQGGTPEAATEHARKETDKWREVIRAAGLKLD